MRRPRTQTEGYAAIIRAGGARDLPSCVVLGVDPGLAHFGISLVDLYPKRPRVLFVDVVATEKEDRKRKVLEADDIVRRGRELATVIRAAFLNFRRPRAVCVEAMSFPRSSSAAAKLALSWGILVAETDRAGLPMTVASPQRIRDAVLGQRVEAGKRVKASKEDVAGALGRLCDVDPMLFDAIATEDREHAWDGIAAAYTATKSDLIRSMLHR